MAEEFPRTFLVPLELGHIVELGAISDATFVGASVIQNCVISTTVNYVRYGRYVDGIDGEVRTACIILLKFGFSSHVGKRIKHLSISLSISIPQVDIAGSDGDELKSLLLELRYYEPSSGQSAITFANATSKASAGISVGMNSAATLNGNIERQL